jgi:hypothetical protein
MVTLFYALSSIAAFAFLGNRFASEMKPKRVKYTPAHEPKQQKATPQNYSTLHDIADAHADYTAEVTQVLANGANREILNSQPIGAKVDLRVDDTDMVSVYINGKNIGYTLLCKSNSNLIDLLRKNTPVEAYIGSVVNPLHEKTDTASIIAFYKVEGIDPTHVSIE